MNALRTFGSYVNRKATELLVISLQRLPFYRGQADGTAFYDKLNDPKAVRSMRLSRTAYEADWPPLRKPRAQEQAK